MADPQAQRCAFIAVIGAPNVGKSTLVNALTGAKVSIVTRKVQTTRSRIRGIAMAGNAQLVFIDTPGIFSPKKRLDRAMVSAAWGAVSDADIVCLLVDASRGLDDDTQRVVEGLEKNGQKAVLIVNKIDLVKRDSLLALVDQLNSTGLFTDVFLVSAAKGDGIADVKAYFAGHAPDGPWMYPPDQLSDLPQRMLAAEITREKLFERVHDELPYGITVETESWQNRDDGSVRIDQNIYVARSTHKPMVIGKGGKNIREIGAAARAELEELLDGKVHLFLQVKERPNWQDERARYREIGLDFVD